MKIKNGFLFDDAGKQVTYKPTPNHGGTLTNPAYTIMHFTADTNPASTIGWFLNKSAQASAHLLVDRDGNITQFAPFNVVTWHAGKSEWKGIIGLNSHSIGIELTNAGRLEKRANHFYCGTDGKLINENEVIKAAHKNDKGVEAYWQTYTEKQLAVAADIDKAIIETYHIKDILGHDDIAPGRKSDPGPAFNMTAFKLSAGLSMSNAQKVTKSDLNVRKGPAVTFDRITTLPKGTTVNVLSDSDGWSKIHLSALDIVGYVNNSYLV